MASDTDPVATVEAVAMEGNKVVGSVQGKAGLELVLPHRGEQGEGRRREHPRGQPGVRDRTQGAASVLLDSRRVDFKKAVRSEVNGKATRYRPRAGLRTLCETLQRRGAPELAFTAEIVLRR